MVLYLLTCASLLCQSRGSPVVARSFWLLLLLLLQSQSVVGGCGAGGGTPTRTIQFNLTISNNNITIMPFIARIDEEITARRVSATNGTQRRRRGEESLFAQFASSRWINRSDNKT